MEPIINLLNSQDSIKPELQQIPRYIPCAITIPELRVRPETFRRDSRPYQMPSWDDPLDPVKISFIMDDGGSLIRRENDVAQSEIYRALDVWRQLVRSGRGEMGSENGLVLNANYTIEFRAPIYVYLCRGYNLPPQSSTTPSTGMNRPNSATQQATFDNTADSRALVTSTQVADRAQLFEQQAANGLEITNIICLENTWLGSFKVGDLAYADTRVLTIDAMLYAENVLQFDGGQTKATSNEDFT